MPSDDKVKKFAHFWYNKKEYKVMIEEIKNVGDKRKKIIMMPDGAALDLTQIYIDYTDKHGNNLDNPVLKGNDNDFQVWGWIAGLPTVRTIKAEEVIE